MTDHAKGQVGQRGPLLTSLASCTKQKKMGKSVDNLGITRTSQGMTLSAEAKSAKAAIGSAWMLQRTRIPFK